jgi:hypothetical protein
VPVCALQNYCDSATLLEVFGRLFGVPPATLTVFLIPKVRGELVFTSFNPFHNRMQVCRSTERGLGPGRAPRQELHEENPSRD